MRTSTIVLMILLDAVHPPAVATSLSFAFRAGNEKNLVVFGLAVAITAMLVVIERLSCGCERALVSNAIDLIQNVDLCSSKL